MSPLNTFNTVDALQRAAKIVDLYRSTTGETDLDQIAVDVITDLAILVSQQKREPDMHRWVKEASRHYRNETGDTIPDPEPDRPIWPS